MTQPAGPGRLVAAGLVAFAGAAVCAGAVRATWVSGAGRSIVVPVDGAASARIPVAGRSFSGVDAGAGPALLAALLVCATVVAGILAQPGARRLLLAIATALAGAALGVAIAAASTAGSRATAAGVRSASVRPAPVSVALGGASVGVVGAVAAMRAARRAPPVRMPEGAPGDGDADA